MLEIRPSLKIEATALKFYRKKDSEEYVLSKEPTFNIDIGYTTCRESMGYNIYKALKHNVLNLTPSGRPLTPYRVSFLPYHKENDTIYSCDYKIYIFGEDIDLYDLIGSNSKKETYINLLNLYLGLTDTVLYNGDLRKKQREMDKVTHTKYDISNGNYIIYSVCSCEFLNNPFTTSLYLGIARDCLSLVYANRTEVLDKVDMDEVNNIIDTGNVERAREILINIALPFLDSEGVYGVESLEDEYDEDDELIDSSYYYEDDEGTDTVNILTNPIIKKIYLSFLMNGLRELDSINAFDTWYLLGDNGTLGIYEYGEDYEV